MGGVKEKFPAMPDDMRSRIEAAVAAEVDEDKETNIVLHRRLKRRHLPAATAAAAILICITAFGAGSWLYHLKGENVGDYGFASSVTVKEAGDRAGIPVVTLSYAYIPEDMICPENEPTKLFRKDTPWQGGVSAELIPLDTEFNEKDALIDRNVTSHEEMTIDSHEAIYLDLFQNPDAAPASVGFDKRIYMIFDESRYVLVLNGGADLAKEEMLKVAEGVRLQQTEETLTGDVYSWSDYVSQSAKAYPATVPAKAVPSLSESQMALVKQPDDKIQVTADAQEAGEEWTESPIMISVAHVSVSDNVSGLTIQERIPEDWADLIDADGSLKTSVRNYILPGDGINSLDETVRQERIDLKLVEADVTFENSGDVDLTDVQFYISMLRIRETGDGYCDFDHTLEHGGQMITYPWWRDEMEYYDVCDEDGSQNGDNYIDRLPAGEMVSIHLAWIAAEDELQSLYLDLEGGMVDVFDKPDHLDKVVDLQLTP